MKFLAALLPSLGKLTKGIIAQLLLAFGITAVTYNGLEEIFAHLRQQITANITGAPPRCFTDFLYCRWRLGAEHRARRFNVLLNHDGHQQNHQPNRQKVISAGWGYSKPDAGHSANLNSNRKPLNRYLTKGQTWQKSYSSQAHRAQAKLPTWCI